jgi:DnaK suppressor protein
MINSQEHSSYNPLEDSTYLSEEMVNYFKNQLMQMHADIVKKDAEIFLSYLDNTNREPDRIDQATNEGLHMQDFIFQEHGSHLRHEVEFALMRIEDGTYGYCQQTGEPIGVKRLLVVPYALYCLKVQKYKEKHLI